MLKVATVLGIAALTATSALADDGYAGHNCGSYKSPQASIPAVNVAEGYTLPATSTTVETVQAPVMLNTSAETYETVQIIPADSYALVDTVALPAQ